MVLASGPAAGLAGYSRGQWPLAAIVIWPPKTAQLERIATLPTRSDHAWIWLRLCQREVSDFRRFRQVAPRHV